MHDFINQETKEWNIEFYGGFPKMEDLPLNKQLGL